MKNFCFDIGGMSTKCIMFENKNKLVSKQLFYKSSDIIAMSTKLKEVLDLIIDFIKNK
ncbi:hypothetical protein [Mesoplasma coleopterae]|uniref:Uncharacterized protein n=1 Tax=Mesoplasma coleopterae TaxID=324078 RepID=A0A2K8P1B7_9MOLU|nr:hypothetical protein [Mesoplasma coleopterae]ATZ20529.1 hypothetical protein MCOLE_v1c00140 [Mesoplasma coleopterae]